MMVQIPANACKLLSLLTIIFLAFSAASSRAQNSFTVSEPVAGGTLSWTLTLVSSGVCGEYNIHYYTYDYTSFKFTYGGKAYPLSGSLVFLTTPTEPNSLGCPPPGPSITFNLPSNFGNCVINFTPQDYNTTQYGGVAAESCPGYVDLKYLVVGVTYAPPGPSANTFVSYQNSTYVGNTESISSSFTNASNLTASLSSGFSIFGVLKGSVTSSVSSTSSQKITNSTSITTSINVQGGEKSYGTGSYYAPVNHDYDLIWVWLNPVAFFNLNGTAVTWNGYGYNAADQNGMDIISIPLGYLNGHFGAIPADIATPIARAWAANERFASGQVPQLNATDLATIASADPFSATTYGPEYIGSDPPAPSTADGRFTLSTCNSEESFSYVQASPSQSPLTYSCTLTYTNLTTLADSNTRTNTEEFSTDTQISASFLASVNATLKTSNTLTIETTAQQSITNTTTSTAAFSVQGPPCNNTVAEQGPCVPVYDSAGNEPTQFYVYQDNMYGTFMFAPVYYY